MGARIMSYVRELIDELLHEANKNFEYIKELSNNLNCIEYWNGKKWVPLTEELAKKVITTDEAFDFKRYRNSRFYLVETSEGIQIISEHSYKLCREEKHDMIKLYEGSMQQCREFIKV